MMIVSSCTKNEICLTNEPYRPISGHFTGESVPQSPDPLVGYRWDNPKAADSLEIYTLMPLTVEVDCPENVHIRRTSDIDVSGPCNLMFDFGRVSAAWLEFDADSIDGAIEMSISEFNEPAVFNAGAEHPLKTATPEHYGHTWRLSLNSELYEGVRFGWIHVRELNSPARLRNIRLVCQIKPTNYNGAFACSDTMLTRIWYTGAYDVKLNLLNDYFGAILMERSDRISWTGDAHPSQAASMVVFGNFDFVRKNLVNTSTQFNGIASYSLYWTLSLADYFDYTGDRAFIEDMKDNLCQKLDRAYEHYEHLPPLGFYGWDERLGAGFENPDCDEARTAYRMLCIHAWTEGSRTLRRAGYMDEADRFTRYVEEKVSRLAQNPNWTAPLGVHAAADAINAGFAGLDDINRLWNNAFADRQQRLSYSPFNQYFIIQAMARAGRIAEALSTVDDCWGGQVRYGGTTFFEVFRPSWNDVSQPNDAPINNQCGYTSLTHPWSAGVTKWLTEEILGIKPTEPGFQTFTFKPCMAERLRWVCGRVPTPSGIIEAEYNAETGHASLTVPKGLTANVLLPGMTEFQTLAEGRHQLKSDVQSFDTPPVEEPFVYQLPAPAVEDSLTKGAWTERYGRLGYLLCNYDSLHHRLHLPDFVSSVAFLKNDNVPWLNTADVHWTNDSADPRALESADGKGHCSLGAVTTRDPNPCYQTMTIDVAMKRPQPCRLSLYFVDWERCGRRSAIEIFDLDNKQLLAPVHIVRNYGEGKYVSFNIDRPVRIRINQVRGKNAALSGIFFD